MQTCIVLMEYPKTDQFQTFSSDVDAKLIEDQDVIVFIQSGAGRPVVLINHAFAIKESNKHDLNSNFCTTSLFLVATCLDATTWMIRFLEGDYSDGFTTHTQ